MIEYFVALGETLPLNPVTRSCLRGSFVPLSDGVTHFELSGPEAGELVLLLPGLTVPLFYWDRLAVLLHEQGFRTLAYSAYGRGYSDRVIATYDRSLFLRQARELLERLRIAEVRHVVGTSMGALTAMALVNESWFSARTMTLIGPAGLQPEEPLFARICKRNGNVARWVGRYLGHQGITAHLDRNVRTEEHAQELKDLIRGPWSCEGSVYALACTLASFPLINQQGLYQQAGSRGIPTLLLWGENDAVTPVQRLNLAQSLLRPVQSHVIPRCGHMAPFEQPGNVAVLFRDFVCPRQTSQSRPMTAQSRAGQP